MLRASRSGQLSQQWLTVTGQGQEQCQTSPSSCRRSPWGVPVTTADKQNMVQQPAEEGIVTALQCCQLEQGSMVTTLQKAMSSLSSASTMTDRGTQTELHWEYTPTSVPGCRVSPAFTGRSKFTWGMCTHTEELLHGETELQEEVGGLRSIKECKKETDYWTCTLPSLE